MCAGQEATVRNLHGTTDWLEQLNGTTLGMEYDKAAYCHPAYLTYMQSTSCEMLDEANWNQDSREKYQ